MYLIQFTILKLKNQVLHPAHKLTEMNPFEFIDSYNKEINPGARAMLLSYQDVTKEYSLYVDSQNASISNENKAA